MRVALRPHASARIGRLLRQKVRRLPDSARSGNQQSSSGIRTADTRESCPRGRDFLKVSEEARKYAGSVAGWRDDYRFMISVAARRSI